MDENGAKIIELFQRTKRMIPRVDDDYRGIAGRIGIVGGCCEISGAPYFTAMAALRVGAKVVHVFCPAISVAAIQAYSPEIIVHPLSSPNDIALHEVVPWLEHLDVIVVGPCLSIDKVTFVDNLVERCRNVQKPMIIDLDWVHVVALNSTIFLTYLPLIISVNDSAFTKMFGADRNHVMMKMDRLSHGLTVFERGKYDRIYDVSAMVKTFCLAGGSGRRCSGQGDFLAGVLATFYYWALQNPEEKKPAEVACFAASYLTKNCNKYAFKVKGRSMTTSDMIDQIHQVFADYFEYRPGRSSVEYFI